MRRDVFICLVLAGVTLALYWPVTQCGFVNIDDPVYVTENAQVQAGLTWAGLRWVWGHPVSANWHPLTMLSHMLDCQLYGLKPFGHHLTSLCLHAFNTVLVFWFLRRATNAVWRSALAAALFGWHPLHVESVAWIAERKDVLSTFFMLLTLLAYTQFAQKRKTSNIQHPTSNIEWSYWLALLFFVLGLMSKPMLVTLPFVLVLLDYWPLGRMSEIRGQKAEAKGIKGALTLGPQFSALLREKWPFLALAAAASVVTFMVQQQGGAVMTEQAFPFDVRVGNALISYCRYLGKLFWPTDLAVYYPYPAHWAWWQVLLAAGFLGGGSALLFGQRDRRPFLLMGWLWYLGTLVPVIGLVQVGEQSMADRYAYIPSLGLLIAVVWGADELTQSWRFRGFVLPAIAPVAAVLCLALTWRQLGYWRDSETLFRHTLAVTQNNALAENNLGLALFNQGQLREAAGHFQAALRIKPAAAEIHNNLGLAYLNQGRIDEAVSQFQEAIQLKPEFTDGHINLGLAFFKQGENDQAIGEFQQTLQLDPDFVAARINLGVALLKSGKNDEAIGQFEAALRLKPEDANACFNLGVAYLNKKQADEAIRQFQEAIRLNPDDVEAQKKLMSAVELKYNLNALLSDPGALNNLAWKLATAPDAKGRNGSLAVKLAKRACELTQDQVTIMVGTLAAAYAEAGRFDEAMATAQKACALAQKSGEQDLLQRNQELLALYEKHQAYHEPAAKP